MRKTTLTISQSVSSLLRPNFVRNVRIFRTSENDHTAVSVWVGVTDELGSGVYFELILTFRYEIGENFRASMRSICLVRALAGRLRNERRYDVR